MEESKGNKQKAVRGKKIQKIVGDNIGIREETEWWPVQA